MRPTSFVLGLAIAAAAVGPASAQDTIATPTGANVAPVGRPKSVALARVLGIGPGVGHLYAGERKRAAMLQLGVLGAGAINLVALLEDCPEVPVTDPHAADECNWNVPVASVSLLALAGLMGWSSWDAGRAAQRWNVRHGHAASAIVTPTIAPSRDQGGGLRANIGVRLTVR